MSLFTVAQYLLNRDAPFGWYALYLITTATWLWQSARVCLQQSHTLELQQQLDQRETEVLIKAHELEDQRVNQLRSDFERRVAEAEMAGLRSQMNPHFKKLIPGTHGQPHVTLTDGGHFVQEDKGEEWARLMVTFIQENPA